MWGGGRGESGLALPNDHNSTHIYICEISKTTSSLCYLTQDRMCYCLSDKDRQYHIGNGYGSMDGAYLEMAAGREHKQVRHRVLTSIIPASKQPNSCYITQGEATHLLVGSGQQTKAY